MLLCTQKIPYRYKLLFKPRQNEFFVRAGLGILCKYWKNFCVARFFDL